jgi:hypothetical protein
MKKNTISMNLDEFNELVDEHIVNDCEPFLFLVDGKLAEYLDIYICDEFELEDEDCTIEEYDYDEHYYVSYSPSDKYDGCQLFIEKAKGIKGEYKVSDISGCYYYVFVDIPLSIALDKFGGGIIQFCKLEDYEELDKEDYCEDCDDCELTEEQKEDLQIIEECLYDILSLDGCEKHTFERLLDLAYTFKSRGFRDCRTFMKEVLDEIE